MLQTRVKNTFSFFYKLNPSISIFFVCMLYVVAFQLTAKTLKKELNDLPIIDVNIASFHFPPYTHRTENGRISGKSVETIKAFCTVAHMKCEVVIYPTARAYRSIKNGFSDVLMTADIPGFKSCCTYSQWSYPFIAGLITDIAVEDIPITETSLKGHSLVMVRGWESIYDVYPNLKDLVAEGEVNLIETSSIASAIKIYSAGRASLLWGANVFEWYFDQLSIPWEQGKFKPLVVSRAGIWVAKKSDHHKDILNRFNLAYQLLKEQGSLDQDNFLHPSLMKLVYIEASPPN